MTPPSSSTDSEYFRSSLACTSVVQISTKTLDQNQPQLRQLCENSPLQHTLLPHTLFVTPCYWPLVNWDKEEIKRVWHISWSCIVFMTLSYTQITQVQNSDKLWHNQTWSSKTPFEIFHLEFYIVQIFLSKLFFARIIVRNCDFTGFLKQLSPVGANIEVLERWNVRGLD